MLTNNENTRQTLFNILFLIFISRFQPSLYVHLTLQSIFMPTPITISTPEFRSDPAIPYET
jgi:hypothetical protein